MHISLIHLRILDIASRCFKLTTIKHVCAVDFTDEQYCWN